MRSFAMTLLLFALAGFVFADDVKLKSGRVLTDLTLVSETKKNLVFEDESGRTVRVSRDDIESIDKKPTKRGEFLSALKALDKKDIEGTLKLAAKASELGYQGDATSLYKAVLKLDKDNSQARIGLGEELIEGRWVSAAEAKRLKDRLLQKKYEARGWKKHGSDWLSPADHHRAKEKLVEVEGLWVTASEARDIKAKGLQYFEGKFWDKDEMAKIAADERFVDGKWQSIRDLDQRFRANLQDNWILIGRGVEVHANTGYLRAKEALESAEAAYRDLVRIFGEDIPDLYGPRGRLMVLLARNSDFYREAASDPAIPKAAIDRQRVHGAFYYSSYAANRGGVITYAHSPKEFQDEWIRNGLTSAFLDRFRPLETYDPGLLGSISGYVAAQADGKFNPSQWMYDMYLWTENPSADTKESPKIPSGYAAIEAANPVTYSSMPDGRRAPSYQRRPSQGGLFLAYLESRAAEPFREALFNVPHSRVSGEAFVESVIGPFQPANLDAAWTEWFKAFRDLRSPHLKGL